MSVLQPGHSTRGTDIAQHFVRWAGVRATLHWGDWLVTSLYLVVDAGLVVARSCARRDR